MSAKTQAKVLRVLQEGEVERLGSARTIKVDVRVIAATNKNLEEEIEKGQLPRGSLLPPRGDPDSRAAAARAARTTSRCWCATTWTTSAARTTCGRSGSRTAALEALQRYRWKGNIRELRNTVERLIIMTGGDDDRRRRPAGPCVAVRPGEQPSTAAMPVRTRTRSKAGHAARVQGQRRARVSGRASCARTAGTSRRPPRSSTRRAAICTRNSSSIRSRRKPTDESLGCRARVRRCRATMSHSV